MAPSWRTGNRLGTRPQVDGPQLAYGQSVGAFTGALRRIPFRVSLSDEHGVPMFVFSRVSPMRSCKVRSVVIPNCRAIG
jgi:hypothetical protein